MIDPDRPRVIFVGDRSTVEVLRGISISRLMGAGIVIAARDEFREKSHRLPRKPRKPMHYTTPEAETKRQRRRRRGRGQE